MPKRLRPQSEAAAAAVATAEVGMRPVIGAVAQLARRDARLAGAANNSARPQTAFIWQRNSRRRRRLGKCIINLISASERKTASAL